VGHNALPVCYRRIAHAQSPDDCCRQRNRQEGDGGIEVVDVRSAVWDDGRTFLSDRHQKAQKPNYPCRRYEVRRVYACCNGYTVDILSNGFYWFYAKLHSIDSEAKLSTIMLKSKWNSLRIWIGWSVFPSSQYIVTMKFRQFCFGRRLYSNFSRSSDYTALYEFNLVTNLQCFCSNFQPRQLGYFTILATCDAQHFVQLSLIIIFAILNVMKYTHDRCVIALADTKRYPNVIACQVTNCGSFRLEFWISILSFVKCLRGDFCHFGHFNCY